MIDPRHNCAWQAQYLVRFEVDFACSAHSK